MCDGYLNITITVTEMQLIKTPGHVQQFKLVAMLRYKSDVIVTMSFDNNHLLDKLRSMS